MITVSTDFGPITIPSLNPAHMIGQPLARLPERIVSAHYQYGENELVFTLRSEARHIRISLERGNV